MYRLGNHPANGHTVHFMYDIHDTIGDLPLPLFHDAEPKRPLSSHSNIWTPRGRGEGRRCRVDVGRPRPLCCCYVPARPWPLPRSISSILYSVKCVVRSLNAFDLRSLFGHTMMDRSRGDQLRHRRYETDDRGQP